MRFLAENAMGRYKDIIGSVMRARDIQSQQTEAMLGCGILNRMALLGTPRTLVKQAA